MLFRVTHTTVYGYSERVSLCYNEVRLRPRAGSRQKVARHRLIVDPAPYDTAQRQDYFGNHVDYFTISEPHSRMTVSGVSLLELTGGEPPAAAMSPPWEEVKSVVRGHATPPALDAFEFCFESPNVSLTPELAAYAEASFKPGRPLLEASRELGERIHRDFEYDPEATTVATPLDEVFANKRGVCQDFAHMMIGCLRSIGLPARYVSGYLKPGPNVVGDQASHAWISAWCPQFGWVDFDPTNNVTPSDGHFSVAWGRDYSDVSPVKGVILGGDEHDIKVSVKVERVNGA